MVCRKLPRQRWFLGLAGVALACVLAGPQARADDPVQQIAQGPVPGEGRVQGILDYYCGTVPDGRTYTVTPYEADGLSTEIANAFAEGLRGRSYPVGPAGDHEIVLRSGFEEGRFEDPKGNLGRVNVGNKRGTGIELNVWSSTKDSLLTGRQSTGIREAPQLRVQATLRDLETGRVQWRGEASGVPGAIDADAAGRALGTALADAFGCAVLVEDIDLADG